MCCNSLEMTAQDVVSLNCVITSLVQNGLNERALALYRWMVASGIRETPHTFSSVLGACNSREGLLLHCRVLTLGLYSNLFIGSALVNLYMCVAPPSVALSLYYDLPQRNTATCNAILCGFCSLKLTKELLHSFLEMRLQGMELNGLSFSYVMRGCYQSFQWLNQGEQLHGLVVKAGWVPSNIFLSNSLVDLYSAMGNPADTRKSLEEIPAEDVISWSSVVSVYACNGHVKEAIKYFHWMLWHSKRPSVRSLVGLLSLSGQIRDLHLGVQIHGIALKFGFVWSSMHVQTALIDMYGKSHRFGYSLSVFNEIPELNLECCNSMITSSLQCNVLDAVTEILYFMIVDGVRPDNVTLSAAIKAISLTSSASLMSCQMLHSWVVKLGLESDVVVSSSLIAAYARSGQMSSSRFIFENLQDPNVICFTAIISAYARHGEGIEGVEMLTKMVRSGLTPDDVTFLCVLAGCDQAGLFEEGRQVFESMRANHGLDPDERHYSCMVNLLGRAGLVEDAMKIIEQSSLRCSVEARSSLLLSCKTHGKIVLGKRVAEALIDTGPRDPATTLQVLNFFFDIGDLENVSRIKEMTTGLEVKRDHGHSLIEMSYRV